MSISLSVMFFSALANKEKPLFWWSFRSVFSIVRFYWCPGCVVCDTVHASTSIGEWGLCCPWGQYDDYCSLVLFGTLMEPDGTLRSLSTSQDIVPLLGMSMKMSSTWQWYPGHLHWWAYWSLIKAGLWSASVVRYWPSSRTVWSLWWMAKWSSNSWCTHRSLYSTTWLGRKFSSLYHNKSYIF